MTVIDADRLTSLERRLDHWETVVDNLVDWTRESTRSLGTVERRVEVLEEQMAPGEYEPLLDVDLKRVLDSITYRLQVLEAQTAPSSVDSKLEQALDEVARMRLTLCLVADSIVPANAHRASDVRLAVLSASTVAAVFADAYEAKANDAQ